MTDYWVIHYADFFDDGRRYGRFEILNGDMPRSEVDERAARSGLEVVEVKRVSDRETAP